MVPLDGQIDARAVDQVGNQDIFEHVQIVLAQVETHHDQCIEVAEQIRSGVISFLWGLQPPLCYHRWNLFVYAWRSQGLLGGID